MGINPTSRTIPFTWWLQKELLNFAEQNNKQIEIQYVEVSAGGVAFHHGIPGGSGINTSQDNRRAVVAHCVPSEAEFHPTNIGGTARIYKKYKKIKSNELEESFFPILWQIRDIEQMFDEEEPKKEKPLDLDDLSIEEIEKMIKEHKQEIEMLSLLLEKKKLKLNLAENFFKKN